MRIEMVPREVAPISAADAPTGAATSASTANIGIGRGQAFTAAASPVEANPRMRASVSLGANEQSVVE
jgi:hypothetical protein